MHSKKYKSISYVTSVSMSIVIALFFIVILFTSGLISSLSEDSKIINLSGSLRMQTYRIAFEVSENQSENINNYIKKYDSILYSPSLKSLTDWHSTKNIKNEYFQVIRQWEGLKEKLQSNEEDKVLLTVPTFVAQIDSLVNEIQIYSEQKLTYLTITTICSTILIGTTIALYIYYIKNNVVTPILNLSKASDSIRQGIFEINITQQLNNEIGNLSTTFSQMANHIKAVYHGLEKSIFEHNNILNLKNIETNTLLEICLIMIEKDITTDKLNQITNLLSRLTNVEALKIEIEEINQDRVVSSIGYFTNEKIKSIPIMFNKLSYGKISYQSDNEHMIIEKTAELIAKSVHLSR